MKDIDFVLGRKKSNKIFFASTMAIMGVWLYVGLKYALTVYFHLDIYDSKVEIRAAFIACAAIIASGFLPNKKIIPITTGIIINIAFAVGMVAINDYRHYFVCMIALFGILCLYENLKALIIFLFVNTIINVWLFTFAFPNSENTDMLSLSMNTALFYYDALFFLIISTRVDKSNNSAKEGLKAFTSLLKATPNHMVITDSQKIVVYISESMLQFAGISRVQYAIGRPLIDLFQDMNVKLMFADICDAKGLFEDIREVDVNGNPRYFKIVCDKLHGDGGIEGMFIDVTDITATIKSKNEAEEAKNNAIIANESKSKFLATMSHEIRTPMNAIIGISEIELRKADVPLELSNALNRINISAYGLLGIINDILDLSKIENGKFELNLSNYDVPSLINDSIQLNKVRIGSSPIEFICKVDENLPADLYGDELSLKQVLNNLLSNALKKTEKGFVKLSFSHKPINENEIMFLISVEDSGQGLKENDLDVLFDAYSRFNKEANRARQGTGLGMNITQKFVSMMNGVIDVKSEYGKGSCFVVSVPQKRTSDKIIGAEVAKKLVSFTFENDKGKKQSEVVRTPMPYGSVLVVDDVETNLYVAKGLMIPYQLKIETADSGFEALEKTAGGYEYDILFMDHMMPKMDGVEATKKLRERGYRGVIIALTANAISGQAEMFLESGFDDFISKPIDIRRLNAVLNKYIRDKYAQNLNYLEEQIIPNDNEEKMEKMEKDESTLDPFLIEIFCKDAEKAIATLSETAREDDYKLYAITAHAMKSACANIGEGELSELAKELESAGKGEDKAVIDSKTPIFIKNLRDTLAKLKPEEAKSEKSEAKVEDTALLKEKLAAIASACEEYDDKLAGNALGELQYLEWNPETKEIIAKISECLLHSDFDECAEIAKEFADKL